MSVRSPQSKALASDAQLAPTRAARQNPDRGRELALFLLATVAALLAPAVLVLASSPAPRVALLWDAANMLGYAGLGCLFLLFAFPARPSPFPRLDPAFFLRFHRVLAYATVGVLILHAAPLLIAEPLLLEYFRLSSPAYMLAGVAAFVVIVAAVATAIAPVRRRLWSTRQGFRSFHRVLSLVGIVLAGWHVVGAGYYAASALERSAVTAFLGAAIVITMLSWVRPADADARSTPTAAFVMTAARTPAVLLALSLLLSAAVLTAWLLTAWMLGALNAEP